jgi:hypothetical protein
MPGAGRVPKPPDQLRRRNKDVIPWRTVVADGELRGADLPEGVLPAGQDWHPMTRRWWDAWRCSPQAQIFIDTDWLYLLDTARLHHELWCGRWEFAVELRLRVAKFGGTPVDRARLRVQIGVRGDARLEPAVVTDVEQRRRERKALHIAD